MACNLTTGEVEYIDKTIADLKAENAKLVMKLNAEHLVRQNVERENAKLRELARDMRRAIVCLILLHDEYIDSGEDELVALDLRAEELGVEV